MEAIESYFTRLDAAVANLERVKANLKQYRASVLKAAIEGRLVATEAELARQDGRSYEPASVLLERILKERRRGWAEGKEYKPQAEPDTKGLTLPEAWAWTSLGVVCSIRGGFAFQSKDYVDAVDSIPVIRQSDLRSRYVSLDSAKRVPASFWNTYRDRFAVTRGDLLVGLSGSLASLSEYQSGERALQNQRVGLLQISTLIDRRFVLSLYRWLVPQVERAGKGVAIQNVAPEAIEAMAVPVPPLAEQGRIVSEIERRLSVVEELERAVERNLGRCGRLRKSILRWAFEGKLVDQELTDEPASVLLERIKTERDKAQDVNEGKPRRSRKKATA